MKPRTDAYQPARFSPIYGVIFDAKGNMCDEPEGVSKANILDTGSGILIEWWTNDQSITATMIVDEENGPGMPRIFQLDFQHPHITSDWLRDFKISLLRSIGMQMIHLVPAVEKAFMNTRAS